MAQLSQRRAENAPGDVYVDSTCIDCDTCRWMAPETFARVGGMSAVVRQPATPQERRKALHALVSCPTASIGTVAKAADVAAAQRDFPLPVTEHVLHCGYHSRDSFGATSYLLRHPSGNMLVDSPRYAAPLARRIEDLGGATRMLLTHRDDVADHAKWARHFGLERVVHARDAGRWATGIERVVEGDGPTQMADGLTMIPTPGHTAGHVVYHWSGDGGVAFTGDHLAYDDEAGHLEAWPEVCWFDWGQQTASMRRLLEWDFAWVLPGHGRRGNMSPPRMKEGLRRLVAWMETQA